MSYHFDNPHPETLRRLEEMMRMMRDMTWVRGKTVYEFAEKWGISHTQAQQLSAEASKRVYREVCDPMLISIKISDTVEKIMADATRDADNPPMLEKVGPRGEVGTFQESPNLSRKIALEAASVWSKLVGADAASKVQVTGDGGGPLKITLDDVDKVLDVADANRLEQSESVGTPAPDSDSDT